MNLEKKRQKEKEVVSRMIAVYCKGNHQNSGSLCSNCQELGDYALLRIDKCPFMETKTFCKSCKVHCYRPEMKKRIRLVMVYSGPRMLMYHPLITMNHVIQSLIEKKRVKS